MEMIMLCSDSPESRQPVSLYIWLPPGLCNNLGWSFVKPRYFLVVWMVMLQTGHHPCRVFVWLPLYEAAFVYTCCCCKFFSSCLGLDGCSMTLNWYSLQKIGPSGQQNATRCGLWWVEMLKTRDQYTDAASVYFRICGEVKMCSLIQTKIEWEIYFWFVITFITFFS